MLFINKCRARKKEKNGRLIVIDETYEYYRWILTGIYECNKVEGRSCARYCEIVFSFSFFFFTQSHIILRTYGTAEFNRWMYSYCKWVRVLYITIIFHRLAHFSVPFFLHFSVSLSLPLFLSHSPKSRYPLIIIIQVTAITIVLIRSCTYSVISSQCAATPYEQIYIYIDIIKTLHWKTYSECGLSVHNGLWPLRMCVVSRETAIFL